MHLLWHILEWILETAYVLNEILWSNFNYKIVMKILWLESHICLLLGQTIKYKYQQDNSTLILSLCQPMLESYIQINIFFKNSYYGMFNH